jgi:hypothetical protein
VVYNNLMFYLTSDLGDGRYYVGSHEKTSLNYLIQFDTRSGVENFMRKLMMGEFQGPDQDPDSYDFVEKLINSKLGAEVSIFRPKN